MDIKLEDKIDFKKPKFDVKFEINKFQVRDIIDGKLVLNIDGLSALFNGKIPENFKIDKSIIGNYIDIKYSYKNDKTKELKDSEIIL